MSEEVQELQRVVIKEELMALIETYYGRKNGIHMRAAFLNNLIFWQGIQLNTDKKDKRKIERAIQNGANKTKIEKMKKSYRNGWFWKTSEDLMEELMGFCSPSSVTRMNKEFSERGWIEVGKNPDPKKKWDKSTWYKVDLIKINSDLNQLGYHLENFKFNNENQQNDENEETPRNSIFHGENTNEPAEDSIFHGESSNFHGESSNFHDENSNFHDGNAIPEGLTEGVSEGNVQNVCVDEQRILDLIESRVDLKPHTQKLINILNKKKNNESFKYDVFEKTLIIIDVDIKGISYLENALMNNLKKGFVKEFNTNNNSINRTVRKEQTSGLLDDEGNVIEKKDTSFNEMNLDELRIMKNHLNKMLERNPNHETAPTVLSQIESLINQREMELLIVRDA